MAKVNQIIENNETYSTFDDILPDKIPMNILLIAKVPAPNSVKKGHYFQGSQGKAMWNKLEQYGLIKLDPNKYEDDCLVEQGHGITDIVKKPREFRDEPTKEEYINGIDRIINIVKKHKPKVIIFVYKKVLDKILNIKYNITEKSVYGFNQKFDALFNSKVFVFPMPGTPCKGEDSIIIMKQLKEVMS